jgi:hypothetical protein
VVALARVSCPLVCRPTLLAVNQGTALTRERVRRDGVRLGAIARCREVVVDVGNATGGGSKSTKWPRVRAARTSFGSGAPARKHLTFTAADHDEGFLHLPRGTFTHDERPDLELCYPDQANRRGGGGLRIPWNASRARGQPALPSIGSLQPSVQRDVSVLPQPCLCISAPVTWFCSRSIAPCSARRLAARLYVQHSAHITSKAHSLK